MGAELNLEPDKPNQRVVTRSRLIHEIKDYFDLPHRDVHQSVKQILDMVVDAMRNERRTEIRGVGTFSVRKREARMVRNPRTDEVTYVPSKNVAHFKPSKKLRAMVDGKQKKGLR